MSQRKAILKLFLRVLRKVLFANLVAKTYVAANHVKGYV